MNNTNGRNNTNRTSRRRKSKKQVMKERMVKSIIVYSIPALLLGACVGGVWSGNKKEVEMQAKIDELDKQNTIFKQEQIEEQQAQEKLEEAAIDPTDWKLKLVNKAYPMQENYEVTLVEVENGYQVDERIIEPLNQMLEAARAEGVQIQVRSAYREWEQQELYFNNMMKVTLAGGKSYYDSFMEVTSVVALPGTSEHQLGIALDFDSPEYEGLDEKQADTKVAKWLAANAQEYGFILRYPEGKEDITGYSFESWHYRYVGEEVAQEIMSQGITLEEYLGK